ncbi:MAG: choice-of-anchor D domain-containing protein [Bacteroidota bacterium]|nr:choice-of-anchor D domain-containing protein [Bacteroidota bacterium]
MLKKITFIKMYLLGIFFFSMLISINAQNSNEKSANIFFKKKNQKVFVSNIDTEKQLVEEGTKNFISREWTVLATYPIPQDASGLAFDGTSLYFGIYGSNGDNIYQIDPENGNYSLLCNAPIDDAYGLSYDGTYLWSVNQMSGSSTPAKAVQFDFNGNEISNFDLPTHYMSGIACDNDDFWTAAYYDPDGYIYKTDNTGTIIDEFAAPDNQPWDLAVDGDVLWMVDYWGDAIYKIDKLTGDLLATYPSEHSDPAGIVWDGQYLWYIDAGYGADQDWLYKIDVEGAGAPVINVTSNSHNYGLVNVGESETWEMTVQNNGNADLEIFDLESSDSELTSSISFPQTIAPSQELNIPITYHPEEFGELDATVTVVNSDPLNSEVDVALTGNGVYSGPKIVVSQESHNYGNVRINATTRWFLEIENHGDEILDINSVTIGDEHFFLDQATELPMGVQVLGSESIGIWFNPTELVEYFSVIIINNNDPENSVLNISVLGEGEFVDLSVGAVLWDYTIDAGYDNSAKAIININDVTGDNYQDIVVASEDNFVRCFNGGSDDNADVIWETEIYSGSVYHQNNLIRVGDIDGDEVDDIIIGTTGVDRSVRAISGFDGSFIWQYNTNEFGDGGWVYQVSSKYDYNDDGVNDVLAVAGDDGNDSGPKRAFCIDGLTGDKIWDKYLGGPGFSVIGVSDFTNDGVPDVVAGCSDEGETSGYVKGLDGANGSVQWIHTAGGSSVWALAQISDINNDNINDIIAGDFSGNYYLINTATGNPIETGCVSNDMILRFEVLGDVNCDGFSDVACAHSGPVLSAIDGFSGDFVWSKTLVDKCWNVRVMNDITGNDICDIAVGTLYSDNYVYMIEGKDGAVIKQIQYPETIDAMGVVNDITGDGSWEVIAGGRLGLVTCYSGGLALSTDVDEVVETEINSTVLPNPFNEQTTITFTTAETQNVNVVIRDVKGVVITQLLSKSVPVGKQYVKWNAIGVKSGTYFYQINVNNTTYSGKIIKK